MNTLLCSGLKGIVSSAITGQYETLEPMMSQGNERSAVPHRILGGAVMGRRSAYHQKIPKSEAKNAEKYLDDNDKQEEVINMKESKAVYVTKHKIRDDQKLVYQLTRSEREELFRGSDHNPKYSSNFSCQFDSKRDSEGCTCKNVVTVRKHQEIKCYSGLPKQIYAYHGTKNYNNVGVGSVKTLPKKHVKRIYLPETDDRGVGSSDLSSFFARRSRHRRELANESCYYDHKRTSSKCVGGILEYNAGCVINQKLSPIAHTKSGTTSTKLSCILKSTEIGSNIVYKKVETIGTQFESKDLEKVEVKPEPSLEVVTKPVIKVSEQTQKSKFSNEITEDKKKSEIGKKPKDVYKTFSSDSLVQHIHDLESPSEDKHSRTSFPDPMENKLEREYRKMFSTTKSKDSKPSFQRPEFKSGSVLKRRFDALRRGMHKKESNMKKMDSVMVTTETKDSLHKDASVTSDPPSLISRSVSNSKKYSPVERSIERYKNNDANNYNNEKYSAQWPQNSTDSEGQGVKGMFKLWGKKFNFEDDTNSKQKGSPIHSYNAVKKPEKVEKPKVEAPAKKEGKKFFFFKKKSKEKPSQPYKSKKDVTAGRCEIGDGLTLKLGNATRKGKVATIPEEENEITRKTWLKKFLSKTIESARSVNIRWNNSMYATSSSTILELLDTVYTNAGVVFKSRSEITTEESSFFKSFTRPKVNFVRDIEAWMIPKIITDIPKNQMPVKIFSNKETEKNNIQVTISDQKWFIDKSEAFSNKIEVVVNSNYGNKLNRQLSSEYLKIHIPKHFFDSTVSVEAKPIARPVQHNQWSEEKVYNIVEYETNSEIRRNSAANKALQKGDFTSNDIEVIVSVQDNTNVESKILETVIKRSPVHRDVVIQGSNVNVLKRCDVIGVGIITQRDLMDNRRLILNIQDDDEEESDDDSDPMPWPSQKKCEFAETYLQEYYRHWTPLGIDLYSWCVSDCQLRSCSERTIVSYYHLGDGSRSCPSICDEIQAPSDGLSGESPSETNEDQRAEPDNCAKKLLNLFRKAASVKEDDRADKRVLPKDSVAVFKRRKIYAASNRSHWIAPGQDKPEDPSDVDAQEIPRKGIKKHVSMKQISDNSHGSQPAESEVCEKKNLTKLENVIPAPVCEIPQPPCMASRDSPKDPSCSKPCCLSHNVPRQQPLCEPCLAPSSQTGPKQPICPAGLSSSTKKSQNDLSSKGDMPHCSTGLDSTCLGFIPEWAKNPPPGITPRRSRSPCQYPAASPQPNTLNRDTNTIIYPCTSNPAPPTLPCPATTESKATVVEHSAATDVTDTKIAKSPSIDNNLRVLCTESSQNKISNPVTPKSSKDSLRKYKCCEFPTSEECKRCCEYTSSSGASRCSSPKKKIGSSLPQSPQKSAGDTSQRSPCYCDKLSQEQMRRSCHCEKKFQELKKSPPCIPQNQSCSCHNQQFPWPMNSQMSNPPSPKSSKTCLQPKKSEPGAPCDSAGPKNASTPAPKLSGIHLKMKKRNCPEVCSALDRSEKFQGVIKLNSRERITIKLTKQSPSVEEIRKPMYRKIIDEDGKTVFERKDYITEQHRQTLLNDMYRDSEINRVSTPVNTKVVENSDHKETLADVSDQSLDNLIEIQLKFRITQGDKTTEVKIGNEKEPKKPENWQEKPEVYIVNSGTEKVTGEVNPKNDMDIKIIVRNYKPKNKPIEFDSNHKEFSKKISSKFHTVSTGYSNINVDPSTDHVFSVHRATINSSSSAEKSKTPSKISKEVTSKELTKNENEPNLAVSSHSIEHLPTDVTEDEITEGKSISSKKDSQSEKLEETNTNASEFPDFNDTDQDATVVTPTSDEFNTESIISDHTSKQMKKLLLKKVMRKADRTPGKNKQTVRHLKDILKIILTDSSDNEDWNVSSNEVTGDPLQNPKPVGTTGSMNNYYDQDSPVLSTREKIEAIYPTVDNSAVSSNSCDSDANLTTFKGCMCSQVAQKLKQNDGCCCRPKLKNDEETYCNLKNEYADIEIQISNLTPKLSSQNVCLHGKSVNKIGNIKFVEATEIINSPTIKKRKLKSFSSRKTRDYDIKKLNQDTRLGISDDDKIIVLCEKDTKQTREVNDKINTKQRKKTDTKSPNLDILQSYEAKKAVLEIYAEKAEGGKDLVAKLPKFVAGKESEIVNNYEKIASNSYRSVCKENIVLMSVRR